MKKLFAFLLALTMVCCACAALADTDKEIQFSGHTFGETLEQGLASGKVNNIQLSTMPYTARIIADPVMNWVGGWSVYGDGGTVTFQTQWIMNQPQQVAGHDANPSLYYYYPTLEDMTEMQIKKGVFYAGNYYFYNDPKATYDDLRTKLETVYGEPFAEGDGDAIFGAPVSMNDNQENLDNSIKDAKQNFTELTLTAWKSSANNAMIILSYFNQNGWQNADLTYIDMSAEEKILELFNQTKGSDGANPDDLGGL